MQPLTQIIDGVSRQLYRLQRKSDQSLIKEQTISNTFGEPLAGPDEEYLPIFQDDPPEFDSNFSDVTQTQSVNDGRWEIAYSVQDKPQDDILQTVDDVAREKVRAVVPPQDLIESIVAVMAAIITSAQGLKLDENQQAFADAIVAQAEKLAANRDNLNNLKDAIKNGEKPDLNAGWNDVAVAVSLDPSPKIKPPIP